MAAAKPTLDKKAAELMSLNVLKRLDNDVVELLDTAGHVTLYDFDRAIHGWTRKDVEGSLFLVKRRSQPRFQFWILNKKGPDNFVEDVDSGFTCEFQQPYLLYRSSKSDAVIGIWFFEAADGERISKLVQKMASLCAAPSDTIPPPLQQPPAAPPAPAPTAAAADAFWDAGRQRADASAARPAAGAAQDNPLARVFASMQVSRSAEAGPAAPTNQRPLPPGMGPRSNGAPPAPPQLAGMALLTPTQLMHDTSAAPQQSEPHAPAHGDSGKAMLSMLLAQSAAAGSEARAAGAGPWAEAGRAPAGAGAPSGGAVGKGDAARVQALLRRLAENGAFCEILAAELKACQLGQR